MSNKKLTQAVFNGLPSEFRWAAVDAEGDAFAFNRHPPFILDGMWIAEVGYRRLGDRYDATDWQKSLIERKDQAVKKILCHHDIDDAVEDLQQLENLIEEHLGADPFEFNPLPDVVQLLKSLDAEIEEKCKKIAQLEMIIVSESDRLNTTIRKQAAEIEALKESQSDLRGFLHEQIEKNFELLNRQKWISVADQLPPLHKEVLVFTRDKEFLVYARTQNMVGYENWVTHWQHRPAPPEGV